MVSPLEIRCPIHGLIPLNAWEWDIVNQSAFQRLRRIRQLAWTDMVYPGAMHTRFEHSLGVMHISSRLIDALWQRERKLLEDVFHYTQETVARQKQLVRVAALLHDVGHGPFSHAAESLLPTQTKGKRRYQHEDYSAAIIEHCLRDVIEDHPDNKNGHNIKVDEIKNLFSPSSTSPDVLVWKNIVSGQLDADRMDYLLRDAYHSGVSYGNFDLNRVIATVALCENLEDTGFTIGIGDDGLHAAEGLIIARYMMFTQLYFHKTRSIYDYHLERALSRMLPHSEFPPPTKAGISRFLEWDDWKVLGELARGRAGSHGQIIRSRDHYRKVHDTPEVASERQVDRADALLSKFKSQRIDAVSIAAEKSWYKFGREEILVKLMDDRGRSKPLAELSSVVKGLEPINQRRIFVPRSQRERAEKIKQQFLARQAKRK